MTQDSSQEFLIFGIVAVILANIVAIFLIRMIGKNLEA